MTEHKEINEPTSVVIENIQNEPSAQGRNFLPMSILVGAILITASIFYNAKLVLNKIDSVNSIKGVATGQQDSVQAQQAAAPSADGGSIKMGERKDAPVLGNKNAKVTVYEFSDFQCPFCAKFYKETFSQLKAKYIDTGKIKLVFRHFPLPFHQNAQKAAEAAECANRQGKFSEYHNLLFKNSQSDGTGLNIDDLKKYANQLGLNSGTMGFGKNKFNECLDKSEAASAINQDRQDGQAAGISGTPSFVIIKNNDLTLDVGLIRSQLQARETLVNLPNGNIFLVGAQPISSFEQAVEEALKK